MTKDGRSREEAAEVAAKNAWNVFYSGDKAAAIRRFNQAWRLDPDNQLALWGFAVTSVDRGDWDAALHYYRVAIETGPANPPLERDYKLALRQVEKMGGLEVR
jgi:Tfp pilus assembly protein PilF